MLIAIMIIELLQLIETTLILMMVAVIASKGKPKTYEECQADLFKAWGDEMIKEQKP